MNAKLLAKYCGAAAPVAAALAFAASPAGLLAQASVTANTLDLPQQVTMLTNPDPNVRKATAVVNGHVITGTDLDQRVALLVDASRGEMSPEEMQRVRAQVLRNLIDETLQIQAAEAEDIKIEQAEIDQTYARLAAQNERPLAEMDSYLRSIGSAPASRIVAWSRSAMIEVASSQLIRSKRPSPLAPTRRSGWSTRSGLYTRSRKRFTFGHSSPRENGCSGSPDMSTARPSSTVTTQPHESGQSW